jgi:hypothetical protein
MPDRDAGDSKLRGIIEELMERLDTNGREALGAYLELQEQMVGKYKDNLGALLDKHAEVQREFVRLVSTAFVDGSQLGTHYRKTVREGHDALIDAHLQFVRHVRSELSKPRGARTERASGGRKAKRKAT